jgi:hypothetical protein
MPTDLPIACSLTAIELPRCCAFLTMRVSERPDEVVLAIDAPEDAGLVLAELVDAFRGRQGAA